MIKRIVLIGIVLIALFSACEKAFIESGESKDPVKNFDALMKTFQEHYVYFDYKKVDPKVLYTNYRAKINEGTSEEKLFEIMAAMFNELKDGHITLKAPHKNYFYNINAGYPVNFDLSFVENHYLTPAGAKPFKRNSSFTYHILDNNIGYIYYKSFQNSVSSIDQILDEFKKAGVKGLILDVRSNSGGQIANVVKLAGRFTDQKRLVGTSIFKTGPGVNDYSPALSIYVSPEGTFFDKPVMVLTNRGCYSACSYFVETVKYFPGVSIVGATTAGGGGMPLEYELPNGWAYQVPVSAFFGVDGFNVENGVQPEYPVNMNAQSAKLGKDSIIEQAISLIK